MQDTASQSVSQSVEKSALTAIMICITVWSAHGICSVTNSQNT